MSEPQIYKVTKFTLLCISEAFWSFFELEKAAHTVKVQHAHLT